MGTLKQEHAQMFSQRSAWRPPARPVYFVSLLSDFWTFLSLQPRCEKILKISGAIDLRRVNSAPAELEALWQSLSGVYKMVMRALLPADNEAHTGRWQQIKMGCLFRCLENAAQRKRQSSWQAGTSTPAKKRKKETQNWAIFLLTLPAEKCGIYISQNHC